MLDEILKFTNITFYIQLIYGIVFTMLFWIPTISLPMFGVIYTDEAGALSQMIGAAVAALTVGTILALRKREWSEVQIKMMVEIVWQVVVMTVIIINSPLLGIYAITNVLIVVPEFVFTLLSVLQQEEIIKPLLK